MRQVIITLCVVCEQSGSTHMTGCYDSERKEKKLYCVDPYTERSCFCICPQPTQDNSHGYCQFHLSELLEKIKQRRKKMLGFCLTHNYMREEDGRWLLCVDAVGDVLMELQQPASMEKCPQCESEKIALDEKIKSMRRENWEEKKRSDSDESVDKKPLEPGKP